MLYRVKHFHLLKGSQHFLLRNALRLLHKAMQENRLIPMKNIENADFLFASNAQFEKLCMNLFAMREGELVSKYLKEINGSQYFCNG